ncbi:MAG TPA: methyltransferase [Thiobacillus sp.]|nr:methyltransferase [Thiobacillus sp.]
MPESTPNAFISPEYILSVGTGFMAAKTLLSAVELGVFTSLATEPGTLADLEARLGLHPRASRDFLDALVALGFLARSNGRYENTPPAARFLDAHSSAYIGTLLEMSNQRLYKYWDGLTEALRNGQPQNELKTGGATLFSALAANPERHRQFLSAMTALSRAANQAIANTFPWADYTSFVDVGTAQGDLAAQIALQHPHLNGIGFDLPPAAPIFAEHVAKLGIAERLRFAAGDFFEDPLPPADVVVMGHILHDWDLVEKKALIGKAWECLPPGGALIIYEAMIDDARESNAQGLLMSLTMLIETRGGFDYTAADCMSWMVEAGFRQTQKVKLTGSESMVIGIKPGSHSS